MKKFIIPAVLLAVMLTASCGKGKDAAPPTASPKITASAKPAASAKSDAPTPTPKTDGSHGGGGGGADEPEDDMQPSGGDDAYEIDGDANNDSDDNEQSDSISIINGSSAPFYAVYLSASADGNPGENIIGDTPLGEGEEIVLPFANAPEDELTIIVEDENGIQYSTGGINLENGLAIELRINGGELEAIVQ